MAKIDFKRQLKHLYGPSSKDFTLVDVPEINFLMIDGHGDPNTAPVYQEALEALYAVAYKIKFASKKELGRDYTMPPLEGLWSAEDMASFTDRLDKSQWDWTMLIMQPDWIEQELFESTRGLVQRQKGLVGLPKLRLERYHEGLSTQILHIGSYDDEGPTLHRLHHEYMPENGLTFNGKHHEIYLSDPRRISPEKLKTILRQPVARTQPDG